VSDKDSGKRNLRTGNKNTDSAEREKPARMAAGRTGELAIRMKTGGTEEQA
jgi:hypothetical protein